MAETTIDELEARLADLRVRLREATRARDKAAASQLRREMRVVEDAWEAALDETAEPAAPLSVTTDLPADATATTEGHAPTPRFAAGIPAREQAH
ncbi:hypothetical protein ACFVXQ_24565, partial [Kitasatospora sp. NPDC058263]